MSKIYSSIDLAKFIMALSIVAMHCKLFSNSLISVIIYPWARVSVPLFFMFSGYFYFAKEDPGRYKKLCLRIFKLYMFWFVVALPVVWDVNKRLWCKGDGVALCFLRLMRSLALGDIFGASWFLIAVVVGIGVIELLSKFGDKVIFVSSIVAYLVTTFCSSYMFLLPTECYFFKLIEAWQEEGFFVYRSFFVSLFWLQAGRYFSRKIPQVTNLVPKLAFSLALLFVEWLVVWWFSRLHMNDGYLMLAPTCFLIFMLLSQIRTYIYPSACLILRRLSIVVYLSHWAVLTILSRYLPKSPYNVAHFLGTLVICVFIFASIEWMKKRCHLNFLNWAY